MNVLAIDTSTQIMGVAILKNNKVVGEIITNLEKNHSIRLMPAVNQLMKEVSMEPEQLDKIVVSKGPGSYTGVRIGLATAKTLAWSLQIPIVGISSLMVLAYQGRFFDGYICPYLDARRGLVFTGVYQWTDNDINLIFEEKNILMEDVLNRLKQEGKKVLFLSPDIEKFRESIVNVLGELAVIPDSPYHLSRPSLLAYAGLNKEPNDTHSLTPNYLRLAEAEAKWLQAQKEK